MKFCMHKQAWKKIGVCCRHGNISFPPHSMAVIWRSSRRVLLDLYTNSPLKNTTPTMVREVLYLHFQRNCYTNTQVIDPTHCLFFSCSFCHPIYHWFPVITNQPRYLYMFLIWVNSNPDRHCVHNGSGVILNDCPSVSVYLAPSERIFLSFSISFYNYIELVNGWNVLPFS